MKETISKFEDTYSLEAESDSEFASILLQPSTIKIHALRNAHDITVQRTYQKVEVNSIISLTGEQTLKFITVLYGFCSSP